MYRVKPQNSTPFSFPPCSISQPSLEMSCNNNLKFRLITIIQQLIRRLPSRKLWEGFNKKASGPVLKIMVTLKSNRNWKRISIFLLTTFKSGEIELSSMDIFHSSKTKTNRKQHGRLRACLKKSWRPGKSEPFHSSYLQFIWFFIEFTK